MSTFYTSMDLITKGSEVTGTRTALISDFDSDTVSNSPENAGWSTGESLPMSWHDLQETGDFTCTFDLADIRVSDFVFDNDVPTPSTSVGLWVSGSYCDQLNTWRNFVSETLIVQAKAALAQARGSWAANEETERQTYLETMQSATWPTGQEPTGLTSLNFVYQAGAFLFVVPARALAWLFERLRHYSRILRHATSFIIRFLRFWQWMAEVVGVFLNERSWYLHHGAHPPDVLGEAVEGRFPAILRACFRPLPS
jgi:hypothetical protein